MLVLNGGSSSIKFALYDKSLQKKLTGKIERIGLEGCILTVKGQNKIPVNAADIKHAAIFLMDWLEKQGALDGEDVAVHRIVQGMKHTQTEIITVTLLTELHEISQFDPDHLPGEIALITSVKNKYPRWKQVACFDTSFHTSIPRRANILPVPRRFDKEGIRKYGFHGISYSYIMDKLPQIAGPDAANGRVILAHLGNGASMAAVQNGKSIDTTMGFTPAGGMVMGTRPGDLDPGVAWYMMQKEKLSPEQFNNIINHQSGLLGVSGISSDMQDLLAKESTSTEASEAVALFCYQAKKWIGAFTAVLNGLDILVFTGGIGENSPVIRSRICAGLDHFGIGVDEEANEKNAQVISTPGSRVIVFMIPTDEEYMMAKMATKLLDK